LYLWGTIFHFQLIFKAFQKAIEIDLFQPTNIKLNSIRIQSMIKTTLPDVDHVKDLSWHLRRNGVYNNQSDCGKRWQIIAYFDHDQLGRFAMTLKNGNKKITFRGFDMKIFWYFFEDFASKNFNCLKWSSVGSSELLYQALRFFKRLKFWNRPHPVTKHHYFFLRFYAISIFPVR